VLVIRTDQFRLAQGLDQAAQVSIVDAAVLPNAGLRSRPIHKNDRLGFLSALSNDLLKRCPKPLIALCERGLGHQTQKIAYFP